jgi:FtsH-binding integral membrane protein
MFLGNPVLYWIVTYAAVALFLGLTAYDTQKLKEIAYATEGNPQLANRIAITGALVLYLDFINLFLLILRILGSRRN